MKAALSKEQVEASPDTQPRAELPPPVEVSSDPMQPPPKASGSVSSFFLFLMIGIVAMVTVIKFAGL